MVTEADSLEELHSIYGCQHGLGDDEEYFLDRKSKYYQASELGHRSSIDLIMSTKNVTTVISTSQSI